MQQRFRDHLPALGQGQAAVLVRGVQGQDAVHGVSLKTRMIE